MRTRVQSSVRTAVAKATWVAALVAWFLSLVAGLPADCAETETLDGGYSVTTVETVSWTASTGTIAGEGVHLERKTDVCLVGRLYLTTPQLDRVSLTWFGSLANGWMLIELFDEGRDWRVEFRMRDTLPLPRTLADFSYERLKKDIDDLVAAGKPLLDRFSVRVVGGPSFERSFKTLEEWDSEFRLDWLRETPQEELPEGLFQQMVDENFPDRILQQAPSGVRRMLRQVLAQLCEVRDKDHFCDPFAFLLRTVDRLLFQSSMAEGQRFSPVEAQLELEAERDSLTLEEKELEFLRTFPSFDLEDPFHGTCAENSALDHLPAQPED